MKMAPTAELFYPPWVMDHEGFHPLGSKRLEIMPKRSLKDLPRRDSTLIDRLITTCEKVRGEAR